MLICSSYLWTDTYFRLVTEKNLERIKKIINEHAYYTPELVKKIEYRSTGNLPYLFMHIESEEYSNNQYAMLDGIFLHINEIVPQWHGVFYLSIIILREPVNEKIKIFIDKDQDINHELYHLYQLIEYIDKKPDYIRRSMKYNVGSCSLDDLNESIKFEVGKIFNMEIPALKSDFDMGHNDILFYDEGTITKVAINDRNEFLRYNIISYTSSLNAKYFERFPENKEEISTNFRKEINRQGKDLFGDNCLVLLMLSFLNCLAKLNIQGECYEVGKA